MTIRIAFTSCSDPMDEPVQTVWDRIAQANPQHLVLLGDQIYMDFFASRNPPLGKPAKMHNVDFAANMHERYERQWKIMKASRLSDLHELQIHGIWDDHDFAWNNSYGDCGSNDTHEPQNKHDPVSRDKQKISRRLMRDYFAALRSSATSYPGNPVTGNAAIPDERLDTPMFCTTGNSPSVDLGNRARLLLTDGRSFRTRTNRNDATVLGTPQLDWIKGELRSGDVVLLASGSTLDEGGLNLNQYGDYARLLAAVDASSRLLCLSGDVHKVDWRPHDSIVPVYEAVVSGAARTAFGKYGAYGLIEITDHAVTARGFIEADKRFDKTIDRTTWVEI